MSELGGMEGFSPEDGIAGDPEELSEEAKERLAASAAAIKQIRKEEKQSKKRDDKVSQIIINFLSDDKYAHVFVLISRLVARNCPSIFVLAILSLIHQESKQEIQSYIDGAINKSVLESFDNSLQLMKSQQLDQKMHQDLFEWITCMQMTLAVKPDEILVKLMIDDKNIDGSVLQLTTFILQNYFLDQKKNLEFKKAQPLTASILQSVFEPFTNQARKTLLKNKKEKNEE